jgi:uncharacterized protein
MRSCPSLNAVILAVVLVGGGPAVAQSPSADAVAAARELVIAMHAADQLKSLLPILMQQLKPAIVQGRPDVERDYDAIMPALLDGLNARSSEFVELVATVYARNFAPAELRQVTAFYRSPIGQKLLEKMPTITQESMVAGQQWGQAVMGDMRNRIIDELRKRGHKL